MKQKAWAIHFIYAGIILLLAGGQMYAVESYQLTPSATKFLAHNVGPGPETTRGALNHLVVNSGAQVRETITLPNWIAWASLSAGAILAVHGGLLVAHKK
ncbi:hypothetical protein DTL42_25160 [Bremerella cremea]|uniref:Uncharacterized protein n=1 Tax=Bremerella cremea TaxID=1031537 RepID=A0A368KLF8_9BACT|nr:hypothetical protein [Bremerella cremea]RCS40660.1 hypothetical protein DTL42_25160 [Bremerella cremea]